MALAAWAIEGVIELRAQLGQGRQLPGRGDGGGRRHDDAPGRALLALVPGNGADEVGEAGHGERARPGRELEGERDRADGERRRRRRSQVGDEVRLGEAALAAPFRRLDPAEDRPRPGGGKRRGGGPRRQRDGGVRHAGLGPVEDRLRDRGSVLGPGGSQPTELLLRLQGRSGRGRLGGRRRERQGRGQGGCQDLRGRGERRDDLRLRTARRDGENLDGEGGAPQ
jgi:hypothetical protein